MQKKHNGENIGHDHELDDLTKQIEEAALEVQIRIQQTHKDKKWKAISDNTRDVIDALATQKFSPEDEEDEEGIPSRKDVNLQQGEMFCHLLRPTGNDTLLVELPDGHELQEDEIVQIGRWFVRKKIAEQVGFLRCASDTVELRMTDNELCANAVSCAGVMSYMRHPDSKQKKVDSPGIDSPLLVSCSEATEKELIKAKLELPLHPKIQDLTPGTVLVDLGAIAHILQEVPQEDTGDEKTDKQSSRARLASKGIPDYQALINEYASLVPDAPAIGVIFHQWFRGDRATRIQPIVGVGRRDFRNMTMMDQIVTESSCGSGTIALGLSKFNEDAKNAALSVKQPFDVNLDVETEVMMDSEEGITEYVSRLESYIRWMMSFTCNVQSILQAS